MSDPRFSPPALADDVLDALNAGEPKRPTLADAPEAPWTPLFQNALVWPLAERDRTRSGLHLPSNAEYPLAEGLVIACGDHWFEFGIRIDVPYSPGDIIVYNKHAGTDVRTDGRETLKLIKVADVFGRVG